MVHVHLLDARGKLKPIEDRLRMATLAATDRIRTELRIEPLDLVIYEDSNCVLPETGLGGALSS
jgi:hypothetical protein